MNMRALIAWALAMVPSAALVSVDGPVAWIRSLLTETATDPNVCGQEDAAVRGTLERLAGLEFPSSGKVLVVNIPSGVVTAYEDGNPVIESRAVVGKDSTRTPEMTTVVTFVRPNPTWTVPESIIKSKGWRRKLAEDPDFFENNGFDMVVNGQTVTASEAAADAGSVTSFVQRPGEINALGLVKIGLSNSDGIYLHDTNTPSGFQSEMRAASAGCVRIEDVRKIAAWVLDVSDGDLDDLIAEGDVENHTPPSPVKVILGYWTAWPDAEGSVRYYPDIYNLDGHGAECGQVQSTHSTTRSAAPTWTEYQTR